MGALHSVNTASIDTYQNGIAASTEVLVVGGWFPEPGKTYVFIDHPAYNDSEMETVMHIGYEDVAVDRQGVTDLLKSPEVAEAIKAKGIKLLTFKDFFETK